MSASGLISADLAQYKSTLQYNSNNNRCIVNNTIAIVLSSRSYNPTGRLMPEYMKSNNQKKPGKSTMQYNSGQYATVTHYRRGGGQDRGPGYQNRCTALQFIFLL